MNNPPPNTALHRALYDAAIAHQSFLQEEKGRHAAMEQLDKELKEQGHGRVVLGLIRVKKENGQWVPVFWKKVDGKWLMIRSHPLDYCLKRPDPTDKFRGL